MGGAQLDWSTVPAAASTQCKPLAAMPAAWATQKGQRTRQHGTRSHNEQRVTSQREQTLRPTPLDRRKLTSCVRVCMSQAGDQDDPLAPAPNLQQLEADVDEWSFVNGPLLL